MILENGVVRTLDPSLPTARRARDRGRPRRRRRRRPRDGAREPGDGRPRRPLRRPRLHRLARPLPDLGARAARGGARRLPLARGGARPGPRGRRRRFPTDRALRGYGWRSGDWADAREPTKEDLDAVTGSRPAALIAKDYHSLWLNSAALALAGGDLEVARRRRRARRARRADRRPPRGGGMAVQGAPPARCRTTSTSRRCAPA